VDRDCTEVESDSVVRVEADEGVVAQEKVGQARS
jgi:hypothetical protein